MTFIYETFSDFGQIKKRQVKNISLGFSFQELSILVIFKVSLIACFRLLKVSFRVFKRFFKRSFQVFQGVSFRFLKIFLLGLVLRFILRFLIWFFMCFIVSFNNDAFLNMGDFNCSSLNIDKKIFQKHTNNIILCLQLPL